MKNNHKLIKRADVPKEYRWQVEKIYANDDLWEDDFRDLKILLDDIKKYQGTLGKSPQDLLNFLKFQDNLGLLLDKLYLYASMKQSEDTTNTKYQSLKDRIYGLAVNAQVNLAFATPEILEIPEQTIALWLQNKELSLYQKYINDITRTRDHIRSAEEESIIALTGDVTTAADDIFTMLNNADLKFPKVENEKGEKIEITHGNFITFMENPQQKIRKNAFNALYDTYEKQKYTLSALMSANVKQDIFYTKVRNFPSSIGAALFNEEIPVKVYEQLVATINKELPAFHNYLDMKKQSLKLDELHLYDVYAKSEDEPKDHYEYEQALDLVYKALEPLGKDYISDLKAGINSGWVDVMENEGKTSGAHCTGCYGQEPYVLLNYQSNLNSVFTIAHELGHAMHSYYSWQNQPYVYAYYKIFVAEVASTVNEILLVQYLLKNSNDDQSRLSILHRFLDTFRGTVYRQTMFAEFERATHDYAEGGNALTNEWLCETYLELNKKYFGTDVVIDDKIKYEWARIPHFYSSFYVYKYATGFSAAAYLADQILKDEPNARKNYLKFLTSGGSDDPISLLKRAGVDMASAEPIKSACKMFNNMVEEAKTLL